LARKRLSLNASSKEGKSQRKRERGMKKNGGEKSLSLQENSQVGSRTPRGAAFLRVGREAPIRGRKGLEKAQ